MKIQRFIVLVTVLFFACNQKPSIEIPTLISQKSKVVLTKGGNTFRDLNHNEKLDLYEDPKQSIDNRIDNLLSQLTLKRKQE